MALILGDNLFYGSAIDTLALTTKNFSGGLILGAHVQHPERYGIVALHADGTIASIEEKPKNPKSNLAIPGLYFFDATVVEKAKNVRPSARGELEITDIHKAYWEAGALEVRVLESGTAWLDTGTVSSLSNAHAFVEALQSRQGVLVGSPELAAYKSGLISKTALAKLAQQYEGSEYGHTLTRWIDAR